MITKPRKLESGSTIAFVAPAGPPEPERLKRGKNYFEQLGYKVKIFPQTRRKLGYLAGNDKSRADAINEAFGDNNIDAIFCVRGGYGALRLLPYIDFVTIKKNPKIFAGYSDITILLLSISKKCNLVTFHGPMPAVEFGKPIRAFTENSFLGATTNRRAQIDTAKLSGYKISTINKGIARGIIVGGNLCLMTKLIGTGFLPTFKNKILFFEDTEEEAYRIDGYLAQLFQATDFGEAAGYVIGEFTRTEPKHGDMSGWTVKQVINDYFSKINKPTIWGFPCGHGREKVTIPLGTKVELDAIAKKVLFLESGVK